MPRQLTIAEIIKNALDKDYSIEQASTDLGDLMNELELIKRRYGTDSPRLTELEKIIPVQEKLALGKLRGDEVFEQLKQLQVSHRVEGKSQTLGFSSQTRHARFVGSQGQDSH
ncbi:MAG: hypothetical protein WCH04_15345 [Gammaproteobacteria bacterium]